MCIYIYIYIYIYVCVCVCVCVCICIYIGIDDCANDAYLSKVRILYVFIYIYIYIYIYICENIYIYIHIYRWVNPCLCGVCLLTLDVSSQVTTFIAYSSKYHLHQVFICYVSDLRCFLFFLPLMSYNTHTKEQVAERETLPAPRR